MGVMVERARYAHPRNDHVMRVMVGIRTFCAINRRAHDKSAPIVEIVCYARETREGDPLRRLEEDNEEMTAEADFGGHLTQE
jgi:hypothetical protein